ncbi:MAG TPA: UvrD-helicase domain-containing protein, partial [Noviherbaspirillum sp.]|nr:UvrD-helicase domain-containing protein [Noviherbaspirillum sp.]
MEAVVIDLDAVNKMTISGVLPESWATDLVLLPDTQGLRQVKVADYLYIISDKADKNGRLLVIQAGASGLFAELPEQARMECFYRTLQAALSFQRRNVRIPIEWRVFHSGSLVSFQSNRRKTNISARVYMDTSPEGTSHIYAYALNTSSNAPLVRDGYDADLFETAVLYWEEALKVQSAPVMQTKAGQISVSLTKNFPDSDIVQSVPYSSWVNSKLTKEQMRFFDASLDGPLRVRGAAGTGKTLVLTLRFLKEIYSYIDNKAPVRALFLAHGQETADNIRSYLMLADERGVVAELADNVDVHITTLHEIANDFINIEADVEPLSLDGSTGRQLQFELIQSCVDEAASSAWIQQQVDSWTDRFAQGFLAPKNSDLNKAFCCDLGDEFSTVLETFGVREIDDIAERYRKAQPGPRGLAQTSEEKLVVLEIYRSFREYLSDMNVVSLDQFIADFHAYLNSFRWGSARSKKGFDFIFADELHLFNRQERPVLGYLLKDGKGPKKVAVAYDPRQSPRNSFFPYDRIDRDNIWHEAKLSTNAQQFELTDVFRYTPQILSFLHRLNQHFPADDLAEEWGLRFGPSKVADGPTPKAVLCKSRDEMARAASAQARALLKRDKKGGRVAVLCMDPQRFDIYAKAGIFGDGFIVVAARDEISAISRYRQRVVLSMPEYVAGLQFDAVLLLDANASLVAQ